MELRTRRLLRSWVDMCCAMYAGDRAALREAAAAAGRVQVGPAPLRARHLLPAARGIHLQGTKRHAQLLHCSEETFSFKEEHVYSL